MKFLILILILIILYKYFYLIYQVLFKLNIIETNFTNLHYFLINKKYIK